MMMSTVVCLMFVVTTGFRRLIGCENFHISLYRGWLGVVFDSCRHASFLSDAMVIWYRLPDIEHYLDFRCVREIVLDSAQLYNAVNISRL